MSETTLRLQTNVPETIALQFAEGLPVSSNFGGDQIMFSLTDGRKLYLPPVVGDKITAARVAPGQPFTICKREIKTGNRRMIEYQVEAGALSDNVAPASAKVSNAVRTPNTPAAPSSQTVAPAARGLHVVGNNATAPAAAPPAWSPETLAAQDTQVQSMSSCYVAAVDVAIAAVSYAKERGLLLSPTFEDVRSMAATFYIAQTRGGAR